jgi:hypothetical protein
VSPNQTCHLEISVLLNDSHQFEHLNRDEHLNGSPADAGER